METKPHEELQKIKADAVMDFVLTAYGDNPKFEAQHYEIVNEGIEHSNKLIASNQVENNE